MSEKGQLQCAESRLAERLEPPGSIVRFVEKSEVPRGFPVLAPLSGDVHPLSSCCSPILANGVLGEGVAIAISGNSIVAPFDCQVIELTGSFERMQLKAANGIRFLILMPPGIEQHHGLGFKSQVKVGQTVGRGQMLAHFDPHLLHSLESKLGALVICNPEQLGAIYCSAKKVTAGEDTLMTVTAAAKR